MAVVMTLGLLTLGSGCTPRAAVPPGEASLSPDALTADRLYGEAWQTVMEEYVDGSFNGQDWYRWKDRYDGKLRDLDDAYVAIETMLASLGDQYTRFLPPRSMREQTTDIDAKLSGIGVEILKQKNHLLVVGVLDDTPALAAGMKAGDQVVKINGKDVTSMTIEQCADLIRGETGTTVQLTLVRGKQTLVKDVLRAEIKIKSVHVKDMKDNRIGYLRLSSFISETAMHEIGDAMDKMRDKKALIIDLRENFGGLLSNAVELANMFLDHGTIVSIVNRDKQVTVYRAKPGQAMHIPLVVLIDGGSASASEIFSGAMKDNKRATLIGTRTFGKGLVQKINPLSDGSGINITISKYLTPNGTDINKKGIDPDIEVKYTATDFRSDKDPQLDRAIRFLQAQLPPAPPEKKLAAAEAAHE